MPNRWRPLRLVPKCSPEEELGVHCDTTIAGTPTGRENRTSDGNWLVCDQKCRGLKTVADTASLAMIDQRGISKFSLK
jgi:hypothetical protein